MCASQLQALMLWKGLGGEIARQPRRPGIITCPQARNNIRVSEELKRGFVAN